MVILVETNWAVRLKVCTIRWDFDIVKDVEELCPNAWVINS